MSQIYNPSVSGGGGGETTLYPVTAQISGASSLPANTGTAHYIIVTTTGGNGTIGQLYQDNGSSTGTVTVIPATAGNVIITTAAFTGGTISLAAFQEYVWNGTAWTTLSSTSYFAPSFLFGGM